MATVPLVSLHLLTWFEKMPQTLVEYSNIIILTSRVWSLDSHQIPCNDVHPKLIPQGRFACVFMRCKRITLCCTSLLMYTKISPVDCHSTAVEPVM